MEHVVRFFWSESTGREYTNLPGESTQIYRERVHKFTGREYKNLPGDSGVNSSKDSGVNSSKDSGVSRSKDSGVSYAFFLEQVEGEKYVKLKGKST